MECEPDKWDRDLLVLNLGEDKGYVAKLQTYLDLCEVVQTLPTSTPAPTVGPTASICSRPAEMAYLQAVTQGFGEQGEASLVVGDLFGEMDRDLGLLLDDDWRRAVAIQLGRLSATAADFLALSAPPSLREVDMNVKVIGKAMDEAVTLIAQGVDEFDADKLERATELFWGVLPYVTETPKAMEAICLK